MAISARGAALIRARFHDPHFMLVFVLAVSAALVFSFLCSIFEAVLLSVGHARVATLEKDGSTAGSILKRFKEEPDVPIAAILILNTIAHTVGASVAGASYPNVFDPSTLWIFSIVFTIAVLHFTEIVPKTIGITYANKLAAPVAFAVNFLVTVLKPVLFVTRLISRFLRKGAEDIPVTSVEEIRLLSAMGRRDGILTKRTHELIEGAAKIRELEVDDILVPRTSVHILSGKRTLEENLEVVRSTGNSRFPYSPDGDMDNITGIVLAKELLFHIHDSGGKSVDWDELQAPLLLVPESMPANTLMRMFQEERRHMAVVVDEYGGTQGIATLEDVLEEIVGEIEDESDRDVEFVAKEDEDRFVFRGLAEARKVFDLLKIDVETDSQTLTGFLADRLEGMPKLNDVHVEAGWRFEVQQASRKRAERVLATRVPDSDTTE